MKPLQGKVAIVTGAGRPHGIGRSSALRLAESAAHVPCSPDEVADVVVYLCSPAAAYLTGVALPVAGGMAAGL